MLILIFVELKRLVDIHVLISVRVYSHQGDINMRPIFHTPGMVCIDKKEEKCYNIY